MPEGLVCRLYSLLKSKILALRTCIFLHLVSATISDLCPTNSLEAFI